MSDVKASGGAIGVEMTGLDSMIGAFAKAPETLTPLMQRALEAGTAILAKYSTKGTVPWFQGNLVQSFRPEYKPLMARWFPTANYANDVEYGRGPMTIDYASDQFESLKKWSASKGLNPYAVRNSIRKNGTAPHPFMQRIYDNSKHDLDDLFTLTLARMTEALATL